MTAIPNMASMKPICSDHQTVKVGDQVTICAPFACNGSTNRCMTTANSTDDCADGYLYWAPNHSCQRCAPTDQNVGWDDATQTCKQLMPGH